MSAHGSVADAGRRASWELAIGTARRLVERRHLFLVASVVGAAGLLYRRLDHGWFHHDDGSLAHIAERVLAGELPHRDFTDLYTGLLSFLNAAVFAVAGHDIFNLRIPLFILFLVFVACFFALARRLVGPTWGFVATLFATTWSVPVYPAPIPSWYLLFLSTIGMYAVVRYFETQRRRWLFVAGACGGISIAFKVAGLWYVLAVTLTLVAQPFHKNETSANAERSWKHTAIVAGSSSAALLLAVSVISAQPGAGEVISLLLPVAALCFAVALLGRRVPSPSVARLPGEVGTFALGASIPLVLLALPYIVTRSVDELIEGVLIAPQSRFEFASWSMPYPTTLLWAMPVVALFLVRNRVTDRVRHISDILLSAAIAVLVVWAADSRSYEIIWSTTRALAPFVVILGAFVLLKKRSEKIEDHTAGLVVLVGGFSTFIQFPFAAPVYFCYIAPLLLLAAIAGTRSFGLASGLLPAVLLVALVIFGVRQLDNQSLYSLGVSYDPDPGTEAIDTDRASIRVLPEVKRSYDEVRQIVARHRDGNDPTIFAGPDAPEIYFLTRSRNPTPVVMDFLDRSDSTRGSRLLRLLDDEDVRVVVLNHAPLQSPPLAAATIDRIRSMYPSGRRVAHFEVRWVDDA